MSGAPAQRRARKQQLVKVRLGERFTLYVDGKAYVAGQELELPKADADALVDAGHAEKV